ncbi:hypothetical protein H9Y05_07870 [Crocinitomicaceae bacterium CZZ-1]|uniref:Phosphoribosyltransferase domain-containing protein n=1 Tax=Taishania pollutisoli TaxID=2766479 RepID=A0A8J6PIS9_9FLAO|nr:phosphoribosyltransferase [Taishania pollutisoli]MBC9812389.1 hypothetical protein [Taishania pollutisoli]
MDTLNIIFGIITIISFGLTIYYGRKSSKLEKSRKKLDWTDLQSCANDLGNRMKKDNFTPDVIFTPGLKGATFVNLLVNEINNQVPVFVGISYWKESFNDEELIDEHELIETNKWYVSIPKLMLKQKNKKVLIVDDFVMSGDFTSKLVQLLIENGFKEKNIKTMSVVTTKVAIGNHKEPTYHWLDIPDSNFYFPWGKAK